jgi:hypothetical protein
MAPSANLDFRWTSWLVLHEPAAKALRPGGPTRIPFPLVPEKCHPELGVRHWTTTGGHGIGAKSLDLVSLSSQLPAITVPHQIKGYISSPNFVKRSSCEKSTDAFTQSTPHRFRRIWSKRGNSQSKNGLATTETLTHIKNPSAVRFVWAFLSGMLNSCHSFLAETTMADVRLELANEDAKVALTSLSAHEVSPSTFIDAGLEIEDQLYVFFFSLQISC